MENNNNDGKGKEPVSPKNLFWDHAILQKQSEMNSSGGALPETTVTEENGIDGEGEREGESDDDEAMEDELENEMATTGTNLNEEEFRSIIDLLEGKELGSMSDNDIRALTVSMLKINRSTLESALKRESLEVFRELMNFFANERVLSILVEMGFFESNTSTELREIIVLVLTVEVEDKIPDSQRIVNVLTERTGNGILKRMVSFRHTDNRVDLSWLQVMFHLEDVKYAHTIGYLFENDISEFFIDNIGMFDFIRVLLKALDVNVPAQAFSPFDNLALKMFQSRVSNCRETILATSPHTNPPIRVIVNMKNIHGWLLKAGMLDMFLVKCKEDPDNELLCNNVFQTYMELFMETKSGLSPLADALISREYLNKLLTMMVELCSKEFFTSAMKFLTCVMFRFKSEYHRDRQELKKHSVFEKPLPEHIQAILVKNDINFFAVLIHMLKTADGLYDYDEVQMSTRLVKPPVGEKRILILEFIAVCNRIINEDVTRILFKESLGLLQTLVDIFFFYDLCNILHNFFCNIVENLMNREEFRWPVENLFRKTNFVHNLVNNRGVGNMGHIIRLGVRINLDKRLEKLCLEHEGYRDFAEYIKILQKKNEFRLGSLPDFDDDDDGTNTPGNTTPTIDSFDLDQIVIKKKKKIEQERLARQMKKEMETNSKMDLGDDENSGKKDDINSEDDSNGGSNEDDKMELD